MGSPAWLGSKASSAGRASASGMISADTRRLRMPYVPPGKTSSSLADPEPLPQSANTPRRGISLGIKDQLAVQHATARYRFPRPAGRDLPTVSHLIMLILSRSALPGRRTLVPTGLRRRRHLGKAIKPTVVITKNPACQLTQDDIRALITGLMAGFRREQPCAQPGRLRDCGSPRGWCACVPVPGLAGPGHGNGRAGGSRVGLGGAAPPAVGELDGRQGQEQGAHQDQQPGMLGEAEGKEDDVGDGAEDGAEDRVAAVDQDSMGGLPLAVAGLPGRSWHQRNRLLRVTQVMRITQLLTGRRRGAAMPWTRLPAMRITKELPTESEK